MRIAAFAILACTCIQAVAQSPNEFRPRADMVQSALNALKGVNIRAAVALFGYPTSQREILGDLVYVWDSVSDLPAGYGEIPTQMHCSIQIGTDPSGTIKNTHMEGNMGECAKFSSNLP